MENKGRFNMENVIEINIEIDVKDNIIYMGEECSSGVKEKYERTEDIGKFIQNYIEIYHTEIKD